MVSSIHSPFCFTDIDLYIEMFTLTFQLYFKIFPEVSAIYQEGSQSSYSANLGRILVDSQRNLGRILVDSQPKSRNDPNRFIAQIQEGSQSIHRAILGAILVDLQRKSRKDPSRFIAQIRRDPSRFIARIQEGSQSKYQKKSWRNLDEILGNQNNIFHIPTKSGYICSVILRYQDFLGRKI